ncbi:DUF4429 domain-containing protein [Streptomyces sp. A7024]|uniref:DUF4429 domain-containing protein n=1 Tax=Streptomyces coryli TaxID=1128680 RepID=A0A6G4UC05_9ACTN|nr:DUF4429 domain-containing protein [Streptomyces coryli]NGN68918.1 DUF4429 domain-containing protein [Streptomyces coryli]
MGDVLAGLHAAWEFDTDSVLIRYERGIRTPRLLQALGERRIPFAALSAVDLTPGKRGTVALRLTPRPGADPLTDAADGQLKESCDPYRLVLPGARETLAEYYRDELRGVLDPAADQPAPEYLVAAPAPPLHFKAYDGKASFDGKTVTFRWFWTGASSAKWKAGDQTFPVDELEGVEWRSPEALGGHLRLRGRGGSGGSGGSGGEPAADQDPASVVFGLGYGLVHESLPFAAAVLEALRGASPALPAASASLRPDPADIAERIRHLGELHRTGLLTDEEFSAKKAELLAEL